jgi:hypothetical protein
MMARAWARFHLRVAVAVGVRQCPKVMPPFLTTVQVGGLNPPTVVAWRATVLVLLAFHEVFHLGNVLLRDECY